MQVIGKLFGGGGDNGAAQAAAQAAAAQRQALAKMTQDSAMADAAGQRQGSKKGRSLLTFLGADGAGGLAAA
jgi:hypothetical protein